MERQNDKITLWGQVAQAPEYSHRGRSGDFYRVGLSVERMSGARDVLNVLVPQGLLGQVPEPGRGMGVRGEVRSYNNRTGVGARLVITVLARELWQGEAEPENRVYLCGTVVRQPVFRTTPLGRQICDLMLAVRRRYARTDYLPVIVWGARALEAAGWEVGTRVELSGRMQSREYTKEVDGLRVKKTAFEISAAHIAPVYESEMI